VGKDLGHRQDEEGWTIHVQPKQEQALSMPWKRYEGVAPPKPRREEYPSQESYEEGLGFWWTHYARAWAATSKGSQAKSTSPESDA
jgi:hypothetical protein